MIQKSNIGVGAPSKNANFGPVEYIRILHCFRTFPLFTLAPVEWFGASQGAIIAYPIGTFPARIGVLCVLPKGRYLLQACVVFCAKFYLPPYKCCLPSMGRVSPCRNRTASHRIRCKLCHELSFAT